MTISNTTNVIYGNGDGVTTTFSFPFKIFEATDLQVYLITAGASVLQTITTQYSVSINSVAEGGSVTFVTAPPIGTEYYIERVEPFTQSVALSTEAALPAQQIENQLDLLTMLCIQINNAAIQTPVGFTGTLPALLPNPVAGLALAWDPTGLFLVNITPTAAGSISVPVSNANIQKITTAGWVYGAALTLLANIPAGAGIIPVANLPVGTSAYDLVQLNSAAKLPAVNGSLLTNVVAAINANLNGNQLGSWTDININTVYQATTDGFVVATGNSTSGTNGLNIYSDSNSSPSTLRATSGVPNGAGLFVICPVRKSDYYQITETNVNAVSFFLPMGS